MHDRDVVTKLSEQRQRAVILVPGRRRQPPGQRRTELAGVGLGMVEGRMELGADGGGSLPGRPLLPLLVAVGISVLLTSAAALAGIAIDHSFDTVVPLPYWGLYVVNFLFDLVTELLAMKTLHIVASRKVSLGLAAIFLNVVIASVLLIACYGSLYWAEDKWMQYELPPNGTAGLARSRVRGFKRSPLPPAKMNVSTFLVLNCPFILSPAYSIAYP